MEQKKILKATHQGILPIAGKELSCAVLQDGTRIISMSAIYRAFNRTKRGRKKDDIRVLNRPSFIDAKNLQSFIDGDLDAVLNLIEYKDLNGRINMGYNAKILPMLCDVYLSARRENKLTKNQLKLAQAAEIILNGLATIGIIALIDEVTGYQEIRDKDALQKILDKYLLKEYAKWAKRFPDEFYRLMFRLRSWEWKGMKINRPSVVGKYTNDLVYERLAPGVLAELKQLNPKDEKGRRKSLHQQWLTEDIGHPALQNHLNILMAFMKAAPNWNVFHRNVERALPKLGETIPLPFDENV